MSAERVARPLLVIVSGTSGAGKSTVVQALLEADPSFARAITATTRAPRGTERDGVDYHFLTEAAFREGLADGRFLEHAQVYGQLYGTPRASVEQVLDAGRHCVLVVDVQGVRSLVAGGALAELAAATRTVFVKTPDLDELATRLRARGEDDEEAIARRLAAARREEADSEHYDFVLVNEDLDAAVAALRAFVADATPQDA